MWQNARRVAHRSICTLKADRVQLRPEQSVDKSVFFRNPAPSVHSAMSDSEVPNKGEEEVLFTPEQIQWIDRLIASPLHRGLPQRRLLLPVVVCETWPVPRKRCQVEGPVLWVL